MYIPTTQRPILIDDFGIAPETFTDDELEETIYLIHPPKSFLRSTEPIKLHDFLELADEELRKFALNIFKSPLPHDAEAKEQVEKMTPLQLQQFILVHQPPSFSFWRGETDWYFDKFGAIVRPEVVKNPFTMTTIL